MTAKTQDAGGGMRAMGSRPADWQMFAMVGRLVSALAAGAGAILLTLLAFLTLRGLGVFLPRPAEPAILVAVVLVGGAFGAFVDLVGWRHRMAEWARKTGMLHAQDQGE